MPAAFGVGDFRDVAAHHVRVAREAAAGQDQRLAAQGLHGAIRTAEAHAGDAALGIDEQILDRGAGQQVDARARHR